MSIYNNKPRNEKEKEYLKFREIEDPIFKTWQTCSDILREIEFPEGFSRIFILEIYNNDGSHYTPKKFLRSRMIEDDVFESDMCINERNITTEVEMLSANNSLPNICFGTSQDDALVFNNLNNIKEVATYVKDFFNRKVKIYEVVSTIRTTLSEVENL